MELTQVAQMQIRPNLSDTNLGSDIPTSIETIVAPIVDTSPSVEVLLSPEAGKFFVEENIKPRFSSSEEFSEHLTTLMSQLTTADEYASGARRPFASAEDERLSTLSMKELIEEGNKLPIIDEYGHLQSSMYGTEQGDRINVAIGNLLLKNHYDKLNAAANVEASVSSFKSTIKSEYKIDPKSYDIVFKDGKATAVSKIVSGGKAASVDELGKIQKSLDGLKNSPTANKLQSDIREYNRLSFESVENSLIPHIYGPEKNPFLTKNLSSDWLLEGTNYSTVTSGDNLNEKYLSVIADAREKYTAAVKDGAYLSYYDIEPGLLELTRLREAINTKA